MIRRTDANTNMEEMFRSINYPMKESPNEYASTYLQLKSFYENTYGALNAAGIVMNYTSSMTA
jgi:hypothetical protein